MDTIIENSNTLINKQQSDNEQGRQLFDQMSMSDGNPFENLDISSEIKDSPMPAEQQNDETQKNIDFKEMMKQSKKERKKQKKKNKLKSAKKRTVEKKENISTNIVKSDRKEKKKMMLDSDEQENQPVIEKKQKKSNKKKLKVNSDQQNLSQGSQDSAEYSSQSQKLSEVQNDEKEGDDIDKPIKKKLGRKSRMQRILAKEGFDLKQLGNDGQANYELNSSVNESDDSYSQGGKKKRGTKKVKKQKKQKKAQLTHQQILEKLNEVGCVDQIEENDSERYNYDSGIEELTKLRPKKESKNTIKVQNKFFGDLEMEIQKQVNQQQGNENAEGQVPQEKLELQFKPKSSSSRAASFLGKVEALKKHRGLEADIDEAQFEKITKQKAKRSIYQLVSKIQNQVDQNQEIDIQIKAPTIAKGKSADLINNTMYIVKNLSNKNGGNMNENIESKQSDQLVLQSKDILDKKISLDDVRRMSRKEMSQKFGSMVKKKPVSRFDFFKEIKESINVRRSKYVSEEQLKNSMKPSKLQQLEQIRQKRQQRRKKEVMYELGEMDDDDAQNVIRDLQQEVTRKGNISKDDLRKLLRAQQGLEDLDQYDDQEENNQKKKQNVQVAQNPQATNLQKNLSSDKIVPEQNKINNQIKNQKSQNNRAVLKSGIEKSQVSENDRHADDMIEEYEDVNEQQEVQMEAEQIDQEQYLDEMQNEQQADEKDDASEQEQKGEDLSEQKENQQIEIEEPNEKLVQNQQIRKQLEDQGIIMPGINNKRKNQTDLNSQIDPSKYLIPTQNQQPNIINSNQLIITQTPKQTQKIQQETLQFKEFRKLRKIAVVIQQKKKKRQQELKRAKQFFQQQAELGSDNQQNDDNVKIINKKDDSQQEDGQDLDQQLQELIDNAVDINEENQQQAFRKYMEDVKQKDRQQLQRILRGDFRRHNQDMPELQQMQEDERNRYDRMQKMMEWMRKRQDDEKDLYAQDSQDEDDENNYYYDYNGNRKKITKKNKNQQGQDDEEQTPQMNEEQIDQKLQYFLMDVISPAKKQTHMPVRTDLVMELPEVFKTSNRPYAKSFGKSDLSKKPDPMAVQKQKNQQKMNGNNFSGNLFNLADLKGGKSDMISLKNKKTSSHMSEELNKNKVQKPMSGNFSTNKLNSIFSKFSKTKK